MMNDIPHTSPFEQIRKVSEDSTEYWSARDLAKSLATRSTTSSLILLGKPRKHVSIAGSRLKIISPIRVR